jgi:5-methylcytosine-specific restriction endonuclease McrA
MIAKTCRVCGKTFTSYRSAKRKYCSIECKGLGRRVKRPSCFVCGGALPLRRSNQKYCSMACRTKDWTGKKKPWMEKRFMKTCETCGDEFKVGGKLKHPWVRFCSNTCAGKARRITIDRLWKNGGGSCKNWDVLRSKIFDRDERKCVFCSKDTNLQAHHCLPRKYGGSHEEGNLVASCRHCHGSIDRVIRLVEIRHGKDAMPEKIAALMELIR